MRHLLRLIVFTSTLWLTSCAANDTSKKGLPKSDTAKVLELAIRTASKGFLPDFSAIKDKYYFKDSILLTSKSLTLDKLPTAVDTLKFKILSEDQLCRLIEEDRLSESHPNYLSIRAFEKNDTRYYVQIASLSCLPYGGGGALGLYIKKQSDTFYVDKQMGSSTN